MSPVEPTARLNQGCRLIRRMGRILTVLLAAGGASLLPAAEQLGDTRADANVAWEPPPGEDGPAFTTRIRIRHLLAGGPGAAHTANNYVWGDFVVQKGRRIPTASIPDDLRRKIRIIYVNIAYDIIPRGARTPVATRTVYNVGTMDMPGVKEWDAFFPGLSAEQAKALFREGYTIQNIRITKAAYSLPNLAAIGGETVPAGGGTRSALPTDWARVDFARQGDWIYIRHADGRIERYRIQGGPEAVASDSGDAAVPAPDATQPTGPCPVPRIGLDGSPEAYCARLIWGAPTPGVILDQGQPVSGGRTFGKVQLDYRRSGDATWKSVIVHGHPLGRTTLGQLEPGTRYEARAQAICDDGTRSEFSPVLSFTTTTPAPSEVRVTGITRSSASVSCRVRAGSCQQGPGDMQVMQYAAAGGAWIQTEPGRGALVLDNLRPDTRYRVRVATRFANGVVSPYSAPASFRTLP